MEDSQEVTRSVVCITHIPYTEHMSKQLTLISIKKYAPKSEDYQIASRFREAAKGHGGQLKFIKHLMDSSNIPSPLV